MSEEAKEERESFAEYQVREKYLAEARRYINIFHQLHVITYDISSINADFLAMQDDVVGLLPSLPGGQKLWQHVQNLKSGDTPPDKIDPDLLPFGAEVFEDKNLYKRYTNYERREAPSGPVKAARPKAAERPLRAARAESVEPPPAAAGGVGGVGEFAAIFEALRGYHNTPAELQSFKAMPDVEALGASWERDISAAIAESDVPDRDNLAAVFRGLATFNVALDVWNEASSIVRGDIPGSVIPQGMPDFKKYLPMFGQPGKELLERLKEMA
ncbi:MAG: hypothetical protein LBT92_02970 [Rickettsiales bacterium]|jgi:hypothetical protein|nr:hypothetical protein [Rickettsiales bacterium]